MPRLLWTILLALPLLYFAKSDNLSTQAGNKKDGKVKKANTVPMWIWFGEKAKPNQKVYFRKTFYTKDWNGKAKIYATCDNEMSIYLNGKLVAESSTWEQPIFAIISDELRPGKNVIAVAARNDSSSIAGFLMKIVAEKGKGKPQETMVTNRSWKVTETPGPDWKSRKYDDSGWVKPNVYGRLGDGPWKQVNKVTLARANRNPKKQVSLKNRYKVKEGFKLDLIYPVPAATQGSWVSMTVDPKGRLIVSDQYGKLYRVTVPPLDAKEGKVGIEPIDVDLGEAQGLLWAFDSLYVSVNRGRKYASGFYRVRDTDGDDKLDKVELLRKLNGGGEHGPHAIVLAPDGKSLYLIAGNHTNLPSIDGSRSHKAWGEDSLLPRMWDASGHARGRMAPGGWICRVSPDCKTWELHCNGFRNAYDMAVNRNGDLFTYDSDMEWDMNTPWYRPTRVCHCVSGAEFGWRGGTAKFPVYYPDNLPPVVDIGPGSPTGVVFGYGAKFPVKYQEALFICDWSYGKLYAVHMTPDGSTYKGKLEEFITGTPLPLTDIVVNPKDGAMYFATGGRRTRSGLFRVTYIGKESTEPKKKDADDTGKPFSIRRSLEAYHGRQDPKAIQAAWPHLGSEDRFIRWAARVAIEHQKPELWQEKALQEKEPQAALEALLALARVGDKSVQGDLIQALGQISWKRLSHDQKLALLRVYGLTFIRMGRPGDETIDRLIAKFDPLFPAKSQEMNYELCKILVYFQAPNTVTKALPMMLNGLTQEEQMYYALFLRNLETGWNLDQRKDYFRWFLKAANFKGGHSFQGFVRNIKKEAITNLTPKEKEVLSPILNAKPVAVKQPIAPPRDFVKKWTVEELVKKVENGGLQNRDYDQGRKMFAAANCFACHRYNNEGGSFGPDLTGVSGRFTPQDLLESIIEPSKTISDQYEAVVIELNDGRLVQGRIINLASRGWRVNTDMLNPDKAVTVNRGQVISVTPSPISMMPTGLINTLNEEEIKDMLAYLLSRGDRNHPMFSKK